MSRRHTNSHRHCVDDDLRSEHEEMKTGERHAARESRDGFRHVVLPRRLSFATPVAPCAVSTGRPTTAGSEIFPIRLKICRAIRLALRVTGRRAHGNSFRAFRRNPTPVAASVLPARRNPPDFCRSETQRDLPMVKRRSSAHPSEFHLHSGAETAPDGSGIVVGAILGGPVAALIGGALATAFGTAAKSKRPARAKRAARPRPARSRKHST